MYFGLYGKLVAKPGEADRVIEILNRNLDALSEVGCLLYVINQQADALETIWVTEVWLSSEHHEASLQLPEVRAAINEAMPLLTGEFDQVRLSTMGGLGLVV
ncbi:putative quinol monooxygenase [Saccharospirillum mangrovi]|uniref:putative quinol monooxygenase n=1 Tax=Saccharospirillum mangrovi TaxID=2161747 RepID=UPI000D3C86F0|nr:antibiotic biosynthesis monooxygenase [Saccharospirillum mangrovi]